MATGELLPAFIPASAGVNISRPGAFYLVHLSISNVDAAGTPRAGVVTIWVGTVAGDETPAKVWRPAFTINPAQEPLVFNGRMFVPSGKALRLRTTVPAGGASQDTVLNYVASVIDA